MVATTPLSVRYSTASPNVVTDTVDGEAIAIRMDNGAYYSFSKGATVCWNLIRSGVVPSQLAENHGADEQALRVFVESLLAESLLRPDEAKNAPQLEEVLDLRDIDLSFVHHLEMTDIFAIDPVHDVDPETGWPMGHVEPHRDHGVER